MSQDKPRIVAQLSCGAALAVATKLALADYGATHDVQIVNAFLAHENEENRRFQADCEVWLGRSVTVLRDERTTAKRAKAGEEAQRPRFRPGTKQALAELMQWADIEEQGEAMTLMIHQLHGLGPDRPLPMLECPRHEYHPRESWRWLLSAKACL